MHPKTEKTRRRVHDAQFKAKVLAQCREPGVSLASVALANGLNANLIRKWQVGRGLKRSGLAVDRIAAGATMPRATALVPSAELPLQFVPVGLAACDADSSPVDAKADAAEEAYVHVELRCGDASLMVRLPQAQCATSWLSELARAVLKR
jgi:transposase